MEFDKSRVYTALNADELEPGSKVILSDTLHCLKAFVESDRYIDTLIEITGEEDLYRFMSSVDTYALAYLVSEPASLKWTDLKIGDIIEDNITHLQYMITGIDKADTDTDSHIHYNGEWQNDIYLKHFHKVEK